MPDVSLVRPDATEPLPPAASRILVLDGAMGTMIQRHTFSEAEYRGERFADWHRDLKGNNDLLIAHPAGRDQRDPPRLPRRRRGPGRDQHLQRAEDLAGRLRHGGRWPTSSTWSRRGWPARPATRSTAADPSRPRYVAGALGPTNRTASISPDVNDPGARNVTYKELVEAYLEQANGLVDGGADLLLIETIFDTLNAKAAIFALETLFEERGRRWPVMISGTITDASGPDAVRPGHRGVLELGAARQAAADRSELRARRRGDAALPRRDLPDRGLLRVLLPERRAAQRLRRVRRGARPDRGDRAGVRRERPGQPARRLLRHHARAHRGDGGRVDGRRAARAGPSATRLPAVRTRAAERSPPTRCSSTSASAPTSPARRSSAT